MNEDDIITGESESRGHYSGSQEQSSYESYYPYPYYYGHSDYPIGSRFVPFPPPFSPCPICEVANTVYGPASFSQLGQSGDPTSYEIEVSFN